MCSGRARRLLPKDEPLHHTGGSPLALARAPAAGHAVRHLHVRGARHPRSPPRPPCGVLSPHACSLHRHCWDRTRAGHKTAHGKYRHSGFINRHGYSHTDRGKSSTPTRSDSLASPDHPELQELLRPVVLLYCWENNVHLQRVVGILIEIMHDSGLEVTDPYADSSLLDNVHRAAENVLRDNNHWLVVTTRRSREICRNARDNIQLENAYEQFHATVFELMRTNPGQMRGKQIFTLIVVESDNWTTLFARLRRHIAKSYREDDHH
ncbi:hypothetical protein FOCC_FOCC000002 [Frankliniella occidentalis]|nr:hypothetical protein FOCC_FOCC000002 [Frankliniella occidentalis]